MVSLKHRTLARYAGLLFAAGLAMTSARAADDGFSDPKEIEKRLSAARAELAALPSDADPEVSEALQSIVASREYHQSSIGVLAAMRDQLAQAKAENSSWKGFASPPPYSVRLLDEVRESIATLESSKRISEAQIRIFKREIEAFEELRSTHLQTERRLMEAVDAGKSVAIKTHDSRIAQIEILKARLLAEKIGRRKIQAATLEVQLATTTSRKELAERKLDTLGDRIVLTRDDLDGILQQIVEDRNQAAKALTIQSTTRSTPDPLLAWRLEFVDLQRTFWESRFKAMNRSSGAEFREALATIEGLRERLDDWVKIVDLRLAGGSSEVSDFDPEKFRDSLLELRAMQRLIAFSIGDLDKFDLRNRGTPLLNRIIDSFQSIWNAELYLVEDNDIVDGKKIPIFRAITVGKVLRLAFILIVGYYLLKWISRRIKGMLAKRSSITPEIAEILGKWIFGIGLCLLVLHGLNTARIPLTAFAFMGGALAIGVGFGTQTILKNFISGIILHFERPLKVGDVVEVSTITGTIRKIGMRASVIQHFDGIETLVPNSILLENQLTNWTFSSTVIRHSVIVGVAYGSPTREVAHVLLAVADSHGLVKKDPPPEVRFDNFGADSLTFTLLFWLDTHKTGRSQLASDLRYMIDKALSEADITIAFPQRDIHFDRDIPLRVELSRSPKPINPSGARS